MKQSLSVLIYMVSFLLINKVSKRFGAQTVLEQKSYKYLEDMPQAALQLAASGTKATPQVKDRYSIMTPEQRPSRQEIIDN